MEKGVNGSITEDQPLETTKDVPTELIHHIQSLLSEKEAARTCVLSKSWLHAWSTIPFLRFPAYSDFTPTNYNDLIYNTIQRYHNNNIPIHSLKFGLHVENPKFGEIWMERILTSETTSCLKELSVDIQGTVFTFSNDILFSGEKLQTLKMKTVGIYRINLGMMNPVIKCVSLRVLNLSSVNIGEQVLHKLLSTCSLLEKVVLSYCKGLKAIKVKNHACLRHLEITYFDKEDGLLEIDNVPSLASFSYNSFSSRKNMLPFKTTDATAYSLGRSVTQLHIEGIIIDHTFFDMIKLKFPYLESLKLHLRGWASERLVITSLSLKRLELWSSWGDRPIYNVQVYAPNLVSFSYSGKTLPTLLFPTTIALKQIELSLDLRKSLDTSFFLKLRELLTLSSTFDIHIGLPFRHDQSTLNICDDLRKRVMFLVTNVQQLSLKIDSDTRVFDAFFSIFHPIHVKVSSYHNCFSKQTLRGVMENFIVQKNKRGMMENGTTDLKDVLMKLPHTGIWKPLTSSWESDFLGKLDDTDYLEFKLNWLSHD